jgi:hypothetical protein
LSKKIKADFYIKKKPALLEMLRKKLEITQNLFLEKFDIEKLNTIYSLIEKEYEVLLNELQYIGGNMNPFTSFLTGSGEMFAIIRILEKEAIIFEEIGEFIFRYYETINEHREKSLKNSGQSHAEQIFASGYIESLKSFAKQSQERNYYGDWIFEFVNGEGKPFTYGLNFTQCGIYELAKKIGMEKYTRFLCLADFAEARASGFGLNRTQTLSNGAPICDHRYIRNATTLRAWPPEKVEEFNMKL